MVYFANAVTSHFSVSRVTMLRTLWILVLHPNTELQECTDRLQKGWWGLCVCVWDEEEGRSWDTQDWLAFDISAELSFLCTEKWDLQYICIKCRKVQKSLQGLAGTPSPCWCSGCSPSPADTHPLDASVPCCASSQPSLPPSSSRGSCCSSVRVRLGAERWSVGTLSTGALLLHLCPRQAHVPDC